MKKIVTLSITLWYGLAHAQTVRIPDPNFRQRVIALGHDTNDDGQIQVKEAEAVTKLDVAGLGIVNIEGINSFINLDELDCSKNKLTSLDISKLKKLKYLYAYSNGIIKLNVEGLTELVDLFLYDNQFITGIDFIKFTKLREIQMANNRLTKLDVSGLNFLERINAANNRIETVQVRKAPNLKTVKLESNPISLGTVDIRGLTNLEYFNFKDCGLLYINFSGTIKLKDYYW
jgi:protein phosphatase 1 regulatory subunit 7